MRDLDREVEDRVLDALYTWNRLAQAAGEPMSPALLERSFSVDADLLWPAIACLLREGSIEWARWSDGRDDDYLEGLQITKSGLRFVKR